MENIPSGHAINRHCVLVDYANKLSPILSVEVWQCVSLEVYRSVEVWKSGNVQVWQCRSVEVWQCGSLAV